MIYEPLTRPLLSSFEDVALMKLVVDLVQPLEDFFVSTAVAWMSLTRRSVASCTFFTASAGMGPVLWLPEDCPAAFLPLRVDGPGSFSSKEMSSSRLRAGGHCSGRSSSSHLLVQGGRSRWVVPGTLAAARIA